MSPLDDLRLRFWIHLASRAIQAIDDSRLRLRSRRRPLPSRDTKPAQITVPLRIPASHGALEAQLALPAQPVAAVLLFHGIGERLGYWRQVQEMLARHQIASLIFHYAGYGASTGSIAAAQWRSDAQSASDTIRPLLPPHTPIFFLGFSMGTAVATDAALHLSPPPRGLILCQPFASLRTAAREIVRIPWLTRLVPDIWRTVDSVADLAMPLLLIHGDADELFPVTHTRRIEASARSAQRNVLAITPPGFTHNSPYLRPAPLYWQPILDFIVRHSQSESPQPETTRRAVHETPQSGLESPYGTD